MTATFLRFPRQFLPALLLGLVVHHQAVASLPQGRETEIPFHSRGSASLDGEALLSVFAVVIGIQESAQLQATDKGTSHPLGPFGSVYDLTVALEDPVTLSFRGEFTSSFADGSTITFAIAVSLSLIDGAFHGSFYPIAGTGRYRNVTGDPGDISTSGLADLFSGVFDYSSKGVIEPPGSHP